MDRLFEPGDCPFVPSSPTRVARAIDFVRLQARDVVFDLGCGDGAMLVAFAKARGCRCVGCDVDEELLQRARLRARKEGVETLCDFRNCDFREVRPTRRRILLPRLRVALIAPERRSI